MDAFGWIDTRNLLREDNKNTHMFIKSIFFECNECDRDKNVYRISGRGLAVGAREKHRRVVEQIENGEIKCKECGGTLSIVDDVDETEIKSNPENHISIGNKLSELSDRIEKKRREYFR